MCEGTADGEEGEGRGWVREAEGAGWHGVSAIGARAWVERGGEKVAGVKVAINFSSRD